MPSTRSWWRKSFVVRIAGSCSAPAKRHPLPSIKCPRTNPSRPHPQSRLPPNTFAAFPRCSCALSGVGERPERECFACRLRRSRRASVHQCETATRDKRAGRKWPHVRRVEQGGVLTTSSSSPFSSPLSWSPRNSPPFTIRIATVDAHSRLPTHIHSVTGRTTAQSTRTFDAPVTPRRASLRTAHSRYDSRHQRCALPFGRVARHGHSANEWDISRSVRVQEVYFESFH